MCAGACKCKERKEIAKKAANAKLDEARELARQLMDEGNEGVTKLDKIMTLIDTAKNHIHNI